MIAKPLHAGDDLPSGQPVKGARCATAPLRVAALDGDSGLRAELSRMKWSG